MTGNAQPPIKILLVEQDDLDWCIFDRAMAKTGIDVASAEKVACLADAVERLDRERFDVILADMTLPDPAGSDAMEAILDHAHRTPVIIICDEANEERAMEAIRIGADGYLVRDKYNHHQLALAIRHAMERAEYLRAQRQSQEGLEAAHANLLKILDAAPTGMLLLDARITVVHANGVVASMVLKEPGRMIGGRGGGALGCVHSVEDPRGCGFSTTCPQCPVCKGVEEVLRTGNGMTGLEIQMTLSLDGRAVSRWLLVKAEQVMLDDQRHVVVAITDITEQKRKEEALRKAMEEVRVLTLDAQAVDSAKSELLIAANQEIRAPMNGIIGFAELLAETPLSPRQRELVSTIHQCSQQLLEVITRVLDPSRVGAPAEKRGETPSCQAQDDTGGDPEAVRPRFTGRVLVVDDDPVCQKVMQALLAGLGLDVTTADDGSKAVDLATREAFDLIVMDVMMPVLSGTEAAGILRVCGVRTPIVALTAHTAQEVQNWCIHGGCNECLTKPVRHRELVSMLRRHLAMAPTAPAGEKGLCQTATG
jgi:CheY-like chemotaxis protein